MINPYNKFVEWLRDQGYSTQINSGLKSFLVDEGYGGQLNYALNNYLYDEGFTNPSLPVKTRRWAESMGWFGFSPLSLFSDDEGGSLLDFTSNTPPTIFKDAGATQAQAGDTVRMVYDTRAGVPTLGEDESGDLQAFAFSGADPEADGDGYIIVRNEAGNNALRVVTTGFYEVSFTIEADASEPGNIVSFRDGVTQVASCSLGTYTYQTQFDTNIGWVLPSSGNSVKVTVHSVRELSTIPATQPNAALQPQLVDQGNGYTALRFDGVDDKLELTFPDGFTGDLFLAGRGGCWVEEGVTIAAGGTLAIGPTDGPNTPELIPAVGGDDIDLLAAAAIDRTLAADEITSLVEYYKARGAGDLIPEGGI